MKNKATITKIGTIENSVPIGWHFEGGYSGSTIILPPNKTAPVKILYGGYTIDELKEIMEKSK